MQGSLAKGNDLGGRHVIKQSSLLIYCDHIFLLIHFVHIHATALAQNIFALTCSLFVTAQAGRICTNIDSLQLRLGLRCPYRLITVESKLCPGLRYPALYGQLYIYPNNICQEDKAQPVVSRKRNPPTPSCGGSSCGASSNLLLLEHDTFRELDSVSSHHEVLMQGKMPSWVLVSQLQGCRPAMSYKTFVRPVLEYPRAALPYYEKINTIMAQVGLG